MHTGHLNSTGILQRRLLTLPPLSSTTAGANPGSSLRSTDTGESKDGESASTATAGLNLLASLLGAPPKEDAGGGGGEGDKGAGGAKGGRDGKKGSFKINLFPDDSFDAAQAKGGDDEVSFSMRGFLVFVERGCPLENLQHTSLLKQWRSRRDNCRRLRHLLQERIWGCAPTILPTYSTTHGRPRSGTPPSHHALAHSHAKRPLPLDSKLPPAIRFACDDHHRQGDVTITFDLASSHTGCAKMLRDLDLADDDDHDGSRARGGKGVDPRGAGGDGGGAKGEAGGDENDLDDLLDLMDSAAEAK